MKKLKERNRKKKDPFFQRVGEFVTKRHKIILIVWLVLLGGAVYPALQLSGVLNYNETEFLPDDLEFQQGYEIYHEQFPTNSTGNTIIVLETDNLITDEGNLEYIQTLTDRIYQAYGDDIYEIQSVLTLLELYNNSYWGKVNEVLDTYYDILLSNVTVANQEMYLLEDGLSALYQQISTLYVNSWFNFSRTYYYGNYNTTLFSTGPNTTIYQDIFDLTNYTTDAGITEDYIDLVYSLVSTLPDSNQVNDSLVHNFAAQLTNSTLFDLYNQTGMTIEEYNQTIYPHFEVYQQNWSTTFFDLITNASTSIVNGTNLQANEYNNTDTMVGWSSQQNVLTQLLAVNQTLITNLSLKPFVIQQALSLIDFSEFYEQAASSIGSTAAELEALFGPYLYPLMESVYELGENPNSTAVQSLVDGIIESAISIVVSLQPPPESIDDIPTLMTRWILSEDAKVSLVFISYNGFNKTGSDMDNLIVKMDSEIGILAHDLLEELNLENTRVYHTGDEYIMETWSLQAKEDAKKIDVFTIVFVFIILLIVFTSLIAPLIPLIAIGSSIAMSMAVLWFISFGLDIHFMATLFVTVTSLGAGVDYCIFIFSRYNEERKKGFAKEKAIQIAIKHAGESVFHSGLTVMVGFGALIIPNFPLLRILGISMIIGITFAVVISILVVPSIIFLVGDAIWWPKFLQTALRPQKWFKKRAAKAATEEAAKEIRPDGQTLTKKRRQKSKEKDKEKKESFLIRFANVITKNGLVITISTLVIASPFIYFAVTMDTSIDMMGMMPADFEGTVGRDVISGSLSVGDPTAIKVIFHNMEEDPLNLTVLFNVGVLCDEIIRQSKRDDTISDVTVIRTTVQPLGLKISRTPEVLEFYDDFIQPFIGEDGKTFYLEIYLGRTPYDPMSDEFIGKLPEIINNGIENRHLGTLEEADIYYIGLGVTLHEVKKVTDESFPIVVPIVIVGVYIVLFFLFGSYFTPIRLILTIAISIGFTLGIMYLVFSVGFGAPIFWLLPLMLYSILMGLGLDYDIFLVTRVKEYYDKGMSNKESIAHALDHTATIITSCGALMAAAYSTLMLSQLWHLRELGFAFALAIILDATVIRLIVVPAIMVLMEKLNWVGPKWLTKSRRHKTEDEKEAEPVAEITEN